MHIPFILMNKASIEILSLVITILCLVSFCSVFTILFRNYYKHTIADIKEGKDDIELIDNALYEEQKNKSKTRKYFGVARKVLSWSLFVVITIGFGFALASRFSNNEMIVGNTAQIVIATGSMQEQNPNNNYLKEYNLDNQIHTYDMVTIQKYKSIDEVKLYDVVAFKDNENRTIVHRIIEILPDGSYITRGDSNSSSDNGVLYSGSLKFESIVGKYTGQRIPVIGLFIIFLQSNAGIITIVSVIYCLFMFDFYRSKYEKAICERTNMLIDLINYDMKKEEADDVFTNFREIIVYKGESYVFQNGKFVEKQDKLPDKIDSNNNETMIFIKQANENSKEHIEMKNVGKNI